MRIADANIARQSSQHLQNLKTQIFESSQQVMSGKKYSRASDAPEMSARARAVESQIEYYQNAESQTEIAKIRLTEIESKVDGINELLLNIQSQLLRVNSATGASVESRKDIGLLLANDLNQFVNMVNQQGVFGDGYFSGGAISAIELEHDSDGNIIAANYIGGKNPLYADVGGGLNVKTDVPIADLLGGVSVPATAPGGSAKISLSELNKLFDLANHLQDESVTSVDSTLHDDARAGLDFINNSMSSIIIESGRNTQLLDRLSTNYEELTVSLELQLSDIAGIDQIEAVAKFQEQQTLYTTYLRITAEMNNKSLFDVISR